MYVTLRTEPVATPPYLKLVETSPDPKDTFAKQGSYLFYEGDPVDWLYEVKSGVLRLTRLLEDGRRQVISFGYPGDIVGFPSAGLHHTDCDVLVDAKLRPYRKSVLDRCNPDPELHQKLLQAALGEISGMQDHFMMLGQKSAIEKIASFLTVMADRVGETVNGVRQLELPMSRTDIGDFLGLTTETVSRSFTMLRKRRIIAIDNIHTVIILDRNTLQGLSLGE